MSLTKIIIIVISVALLSYLSSLIPFFTKHREYYDKIYAEFFKDSIKETIVIVDYRDHAVFIKVKNGTEYLCDPITNKENGGNNYFVHVAEVGDSLIKKKNQMNFLLIKNNGTKYKFDLIDRRHLSIFYKCEAK